MNIDENSDLFEMIKDLEERIIFLEEEIDKIANILIKMTGAIFELQEKNDNLQP